MRATPNTGRGGYLADEPLTIASPVRKTGRIFIR
jgi:hypothetical protein